MTTNTPGNRGAQMIRLVDYAKLVGRTYQQVHNDLLKGRIRGERIKGRWFVWRPAKQKARSEGRRASRER